MVVAERHSTFATVMAVSAHFVDDPNTLKAFFACATGKPLVAFCASLSLLHFAVILACGVLALEDATTSTTRHQNTRTVSTNAIANKHCGSRRRRRRRTERQTWNDLKHTLLPPKPFRLPVELVVSRRVLISSSASETGSFPAIVTPLSERLSLTNFSTTPSMKLSSRLAVKRRP